VPDPSRPLRVLQLIGDTDVTVEHVAAVALHRDLHGHGVEVRTLALAPGRTGGLEHDVPAVAPGRRSFAARGQVAKESRWADVVVLHAPLALTWATTPSPFGRRMPVVVAFWEDPAAGGGRVGRAQRRILSSAAVVVAPSTQAARTLESRFGDAVRVQVVRADLAEVDRPLVDGAAWARLLGESAR
jgi:hypothetical protein